MKKITNILGVLLLTITCLSIQTQSSVAADSGGCSAEAPCGTWAVVDSGGLVTTTISCQTMVCGAGGEWNGRLPNNANECPGCKLVLQVPANPITHSADPGVHSDFRDGSNIVVTYNDSTGVFKAPSGTFLAPVVERYQDGTSLTTLQTTVLSKLVTFKPSDFQNGETKFTPVIDDTTGATLYVYQYKDALETVQQLTFDSPKTKEEIQTAMFFNDFSLMFVWFDRYLSMLDGWVLPTP